MTNDSWQAAISWEYEGGEGASPANKWMLTIPQIPNKHLPFSSHDNVLFVTKTAFITGLNNALFIEPNWIIYTEGDTLKSRQCVSVCVCSFQELRLSLYPWTVTHVK